MFWKCKRNNRKEERKGKKKERKRDLSTRRSQNCHCFVGNLQKTQANQWKTIAFVERIK